MRYCGASILASAAHVCNFDSATYPGTEQLSQVASAVDTEGRAPGVCGQKRRSQRWRGRGLGESEWAQY